MDPISQIMTQQHRYCDDLFSQMEQAVSNAQWEDASHHWEQFNQATLAHFNNEEEILFPEFEARTGQRGGPTQVMRMEHVQMRSLLEGLQQAVMNHYADQVLGVAETLMLMMQQHNIKEEQILYPMIDQQMGTDSDTRERINPLHP